MSNEVSIDIIVSQGGQSTADRGDRVDFRKEHMKKQAAHAQKGDKNKKFPSEKVESPKDTPKEETKGESEKKEQENLKTADVHSEVKMSPDTKKKPEKKFECNLSGYIVGVNGVKIVHIVLKV